MNFNWHMMKTPLSNKRCGELKREKQVFCQWGRPCDSLCHGKCVSLEANGQNFREDNARSNSCNAATVHVKELWFGIWSATWITLLTHFPKFEAQPWRETQIHATDVETCCVHMQTRCWPGEVFPAYSTLDNGGCCHHVYPLRRSKEQQ